MFAVILILFFISQTNCFSEHPAAPTGLIPALDGTVGARVKKILPLEQNYSASEK